MLNYWITQYRFAQAVPSSLEDIAAELALTTAQRNYPEAVYAYCLPLGPVGEQILSPKKNQPVTGWDYYMLEASRYGCQACYQKGMAVNSSGETIVKQNWKTGMVSGSYSA